MSPGMPADPWPEGAGGAGDAAAGTMLLRVLGSMSTIELVRAVRALDEGEARFLLVVAVLQQQLDAGGDR